MSRVKRAVVKIGTNSLTNEAGRLDPAVVGNLASQVAAVMKSGVQLTLVASGAIGAGIAQLDLPGRPKDISQLQASAAVGQGQLMRIFDDAFAPHGVKVAQVLLTREDFETRKRYLNIRNTLAALYDYGVLPIINENDAVAVDEIRFGDNDIIAAHVAGMVGAELLILMTVVDGVLKDGQTIDVIHQVDDDALSVVGAHRSKLGSGGMKSKMTSAGMMTRAGGISVIVGAGIENVLPRLISGERLGTLFVPAESKMSSRRRWIGQAAKAAGKIVIDDGAVRAIVQRGKSLLPSGVIGVLGQFKKGATVAIVDGEGREIARGLAEFSSSQLEKIMGKKTAQIADIIGSTGGEEAVHRNNMMLS